MKLLFYLSKKRINSISEAPIYCRITMDNERCEISTSLFVKIENFKNGFVCNNHPQQDVYNAKIDYIKSKLNALHLELIYTNEIITPHILKQKFLNKKVKPIKFIQVLEGLKTEINESDVTPGTKNNYKARAKNLEGFLVKFNLQNIYCDDFDLKMLQKLEDYLHNTKHFKYNHCNRHLFFVGQVLKKGIQLNVATKNNVAYYKKQKDVEKPLVALTKKELIILEQHKFASERLQNVADLYIFQCYTGFAYVDLCDFNVTKHLQILNKNVWVKKNRIKTNTEALLPLFNKAKQILKKYNNNLPLLTNQKYNSYIKEVSEILGFNKHLTTHTARKTFAMIKLNEGISIESVSKMMGHNSIIITQKTYAKVTHIRIENEMNNLRLR